MAAELAMTLAMPDLKFPFDREGVTSELQAKFYEKAGAPDHEDPGLRIKRVQEGTESQWRGGAPRQGTARATPAVFKCRN